MTDLETSPDLPVCELPDGAPAILAAPLPEKRFGAGKAFLIFFAQFASQMVAAFGVAIVVVVILAVGGSDVSDPKVVEQWMPMILAPSLLGAMLVGAIVTIVLTLVFARQLILDRSATGIAFSPGRPSQILLGCVAGLTLSLGYLLIASQMSLTFPEKDMGPVAKMAGSSGWMQAVWMVVALVLAPPVEEFLFRGVLFSGISRSWGIPVASVVVSIMFVALHLTETIHFPPATLMISLLAIGTVTARLLTRSLGPPIAMHLSYNAVIALSVGLATH